jgi:hypothetical protein
MRILYLDHNLQYINPTRNNIPLLLKKIGELYMYGQGYQSDTILSQGVDKFYDANGPFDIVVTNEIVFFGNQDVSSDLRVNQQEYSKTYSYQFSLNNLWDISNELYNFFEKVKNNKVIFMLQTDYYNFRKNKIDRLKELDLYIIGFGEELISHTDELEDLIKEKFYTNANNNWYNFVKNNNKLLSLPHFVNSNEFSFEDISNRKKTIYVGGANYYHREKVINVVRKTNYNKDVTNFHSTMYSLLRKFRVKPDGNLVLMKLYNILFQSELNRSKYGFTCGSGLEWPIRKFFEIPASGALLMAKPFKNADNLGFEDNTTYLEVDYRNIIEKINYLKDNDQIAQQIAKNGQDMVWKTHSLEARTMQLTKSFEAIIDSSFKNSYWKNGKFFIQ